MITSTIIVIICFFMTTFECWNMYKLFKSCDTVKCKVITSSEVTVRRDGYLTDRYYKTQVSFIHDNNTHHAVLKTSTYCQPNQILGCYYNSSKNLVFRKKDLKKQIKNRHIIIMTVGILFLVLNFTLTLSKLSAIVIKYIIFVLSYSLIVFFLIVGIGNIIYTINAIRNTSISKVIYVEAEISDIIRSTRYFNNTERYFYFPVYKYYFNGEKHETKSKLKLRYPPKKGSIVSIPINRKKAGPVEYRDVWDAFFMGVCLILFSFLFLYILN